MSLARKGLMMAGGTYATIAVQVVQTMILSRALGKAGVGELTFFRTTCMLGIQIASLGLPTAMIHEINKSASPSYKVLKNVVRCTMLLTIVALCFLFLLTGVFAKSFFGDMEWPMFLAMSIWLPTLQLKIIYLNYNAIDLDARKLAALAFFPPLVLLTWYFTAWNTIGISVEWAVFAEAMIYAAGGMLLGWWLSRGSIKKIKRDYCESPEESGAVVLGIDWTLIRRLVPFGLQLVVTDFLMLVNGYILLTLLRWFTNDFDEMGIYSRGLRLGMLTIMAIQALQRLLYSSWSKLEGKQQLRSVERVVNACVVMAVCLAVFVAFAAKPLTLFLFGKDFLPAVPVTRITLIGLSIYIVVYLLQSFFNSRKKTTYNMIVFGVGLICNLVFGLILIPSMKAKGAAWAVSCGYVAMTVAALYIGCVKCGLGFRAMFVPDFAMFSRVFRSLFSRKNDSA